MRGRRGLRVNVGCGRTGRAGWVNLDAVPAEGVNCVYDARKSLPFEDGAVRAIFCEHFLEHIDYAEEVPYFLSECLRVLEPGGVLRVVVPDAGRYLQGYAQGGWNAIAAIRPLDAERRDPWPGDRYHTPLEVVNAVFRQGGEHRYAYDAETLVFVLEFFGFERVVQRAYGESPLDWLALEQPGRERESLVVEGLRPGGGGQSAG
jgi:predicted SAM-dependent methyltransferase